MPRFLTVDDVLTLHRRQLGRFGGGDGLRDRGMLESAVAQPSASFGGEWLHPTVWEQAAAYLFHICSNHPFVDGNKRVALLSALVFLRANGVVIRGGTAELTELTLGVAAGRVDKLAIVACLRSLAGH